MGWGCKSHVGCSTSGFPPKKLKKEIILLEVDRKEITVATFKAGDIIKIILALICILLKNVISIGFK